jgi:hypothetical protein
MSGFGLMEVIGAQNMGNAPMAGMGRLRGMSALGAYPTIHGAVTHFQGYYNAHLGDINALHEGRGYNALGSPDGLWGPNTNYAYWAVADWFIAKGDPCVGSGVTSQVARNRGPKVAIAECLSAAGFDADEIDQLQIAWAEWMAEDARRHGAGETNPPDEDAGGGGPGPLDNTTPTTEEESSVWPWILGGAALLVLGIIIFKKKR